MSEHTKQYHLNKCLSLIILFTISYLVDNVSPARLPDPDVQPDDRLNTISDQLREDPIKQIMSKECLTSYSPFCLKLTLMNMIGRSGSVDYNILPGITITSTGLRPTQTSVQRIMSEPGLVDSMLMERLSDYLASLSLNVRILGGAEKSNNNRVDSEENGIATGRKRDKYGSSMLAAAAMSAGTMAMVAMAALAAISGKALMAAMVALMLAGIAALSKGGNDDHKTTYEIVAKPVVSHAHTHSTEVQHGHGHGHGHYKRSLDDITARAHDLAYSGQKPL